MSSSSNFIAKQQKGYRLSELYLLEEHSSKMKAINVKYVLQKLTRNKHKQHNTFSGGENFIMHFSDGKLNDFRECPEFWVSKEAIPFEYSTKKLLHSFLKTNK